MSRTEVECLLRREDLGMQMTLEEATERLRKLEDELPKMIEEHPEDGDFWSAFAGAADCIVDGAPDHAEFIRGRLNCMLGGAGLVPSDNEGEDCVQ